MCGRSMRLEEKYQADAKGIATKHDKSPQMHSRLENSYERAMNIARTWNPKNRSRLRRREDLPGTEKMREDAATLWYVQVDAAARDEAEVDGGGGAPKPAT